MSSNKAAIRDVSDREIPAALQCTEGGYSQARYIEIMQRMPDFEGCEDLHKSVAVMMRTLRWPISRDHDTSEASRTRWKRSLNRNQRPSTQDTLVAILCHRIKKNSLTGYPASMIEGFEAAGLNLAECMYGIHVPNFTSKPMSLAKWNALKAALAVVKNTPATARSPPPHIPSNNAAKRTGETLEPPSQKKIKTDEEINSRLGSRTNPVSLEAPLHENFDILANECQKKIDKCEDDIKKKYETLERDFMTKSAQWDDNIKQKSEKLEALESSINLKLAYLEDQNKLESERVKREHKAKLDQLEEQIKVMKQQT